MLEIPLDGNFAVRSSVSGNVLNVKRCEKEGIQDDILHADFTAEWVGIAQAKRVAAGQSAIGHRGVQFQLCEPAIGMEISIEAADNFLADTEIHHADTAVSGQRVIRTRSFQPESKLACNWETLRLNFFNFIEWQCRADQVGGNVLGGELIAERAGDNASSPAGFFSRREHSQLGVSDARLVGLHVEPATQTIEFDSIHFSIREIEKAVQPGFSACSSTVKLSGQQAFQRIGFASQCEDATHRDFLEIGVSGPFVLGTETPVVKIQGAFEIGLHRAGAEVAAGDGQFGWRINYIALQ